MWMVLVGQNFVILGNIPFIIWTDEMELNISEWERFFILLIIIYLFI